MRQPRKTSIPRFLPWVAWLALALGCGSPFSPTALSQTSSNGPRRFMSVAIGDVVRTEVTTADVPCDSGFYCKFFELTTPREGTLEVGLTHSPGRIFGTPGSTPIDMWVTGGRHGPVWMNFTLATAKGLRLCPPARAAHFRSVSSATRCPA